MVDDRRGAILRAVVQQYIQTSQPVSSAQVADVSGVRASSATVRNELVALEREGFLKQPHTSAGRVPTDLGYRFYVDQLSTTGMLAPAQQADVRTFFDKASGEIEQMLHDTGRLLSDLTGSAALIVGPDHETTTVRSIHLVTLGKRIALAVIVFSNGVVEKRTLELSDGTTDQTVVSASARLSEHLQDKALGDWGEVPPSGDAAIDMLILQAHDALKSGHESDGDHVYLRGASQLAVAFEAVETVRNVLSILEQHYVVVTLLRDLMDRGISVSIGAEHNVQLLAHCSLVVAPTIVDGEKRGSVAVLGPTRMDYSQAMAAVNMVSLRLGEHLTEGQ